jgi:hypothetical protein
MRTSVSRNVSLCTLGCVKSTEVSYEPAAYHTVRRHIAKGQDFHLWSWEPQISHSPEFAPNNYGNRQVLGQDTLFMTGVPTVYLPHNSVTRNLLENRLSEYGAKQGPTTGRTSRALRRHWDNWRDGASQFRFPRAKECLRNLGAHPRINSLILSRKSLKNIGLKWRQIISQHGTPKCLGPALEKNERKPAKYV